jgi:F-type H+-transporting ATPase subunit delta
MTPRAAALRYARALFDVALKEGDPEAVKRDLAAVTELIQQHEDLHKALSNPALPVPRKRAIVDALLSRAEGLSPIVARLLGLLADRDRLALLPDLLAAYGHRLRQHQQIVQADVTTALPLAEDRTRALQASLATATGKQVTIATRVDPSILGGVVARIGSTVYDGSVKRQLEKLKEKLSETA